MTAILNSAILYSTILDSAILVFPLKLTHTYQDWFQLFPQKNLHWFIGSHHLHKKNFTHSFSLNLMMAAILNSADLPSAILVFPLKLTHTCQDCFPLFAQKIFTHSFLLNLMMAAILNSAMLDSNTLFSSLRFTQKHSLSTLTLTKTDLIWLKLIHSHLTRWWQSSWILLFCLQPS